MKSDVMDSRVLDGPAVHRPKANHEMCDAEGLNSEKARKRTQMEPAILKQLVTEVKETRDVAASEENRSSFGLVDMWNIRKHGRYAGKPRQKGTIVTGISY